MVASNAPEIEAGMMGITISAASLVILILGPAAGGDERGSEPPTLHLQDPHL